MKKIKNIDYCNCTGCGAEVFVSPGERTCPVCGKKESLHPLKKNTDFVRLTEQLQLYGWAWTIHALELITLCDRIPDEKKTQQSLAHWKTWRTDTKNIRNIIRAG